MPCQSSVDCQVVVNVIATKDVTVTVITKTLDFNNMTPEEARVFLRKVMGPDKRTIEGTERDHLFTVFNLLEPMESSNNQRSFTEVYEHAGKTYHVHYFEGETVLEEILPDDIQ